MSRVPMGPRFTGEQQGGPITYFPRSMGASPWWGRIAATSVANGLTAVFSSTLRSSRALFNCLTVGTVGAYHGAGDVADVVNSSAIRPAWGVVVHPPSPRCSEMRRLYIGNLSWSATPYDLRAVASEHGTVTDVRIPVDQDSRPRGFGW